MSAPAAALSRITSARRGLLPGHERARHGPRKAEVWWKYESPTDPTSLAADAAFERVVGRPAPATALETAPLPGLPGPFARVEQRLVPWALPQTVESYVGYHASRENLRRAAGRSREKVLEEMRRSLSAMHPTGRFTMPYEQRLWLLHKEGPA